MSGLRSDRRWGLLLLILALPAVYPALVQDLASIAYDAATEHVLRAVAFSQAISDGYLYPRWTQVLHLGLGSPLFTFQPPLPYFALDLLYRVGIPHPAGWRILIAVSMLAAATGAYKLVYELVRRRLPALVAGVAYLYAPYVLRNLLERGSNEAFSMALYPWVLWALIWLAARPATGRFIAATLLWAACIASHVLGPLMLAPVAGVVALGLAWKRRTWLPLVALLAGGLLTAAIWLPMAPEQQFVHVERDFASADAQPLRNPIPLDRLLAPPAVFDAGRDNNNTGDRIGLVHTLLLIAAVPAALAAWRLRRRSLAAWLAFAAAAGLILLWMFTSASDPLWSAGAPVLGRLLYRTRLMGVQALAVAAATGLALTVLPARIERAAATIVMAAIVVSAMPSLYVELLHRYTTVGDMPTLADVRAQEARSGGTALTAFGEFEPRWRTQPVTEDYLPVSAGSFDAERYPLAPGTEGSMAVLRAAVDSAAWDLELEAATDGAVVLHTLYYPRWRGYLDGQAVELRPQAETGLVQLQTVPAGRHRLQLRYEISSVELAGRVITFLTALGLAAACVVAAVRRRGQQQTDARTEAEREPGPPVWLLGALALVVLAKALYVDPQTTWLRCESTAETICGADTVATARFDRAPSLRGFSVSNGAVRPGEEVRLSLFWQGAGENREVRSFVHIRNSRPDQPGSPRSGEVWVQADHEVPGWPAVEYVPGKLYLDEFRLRLPADMPPGEYRLEVGWSDRQTGEQVDVDAPSLEPPLKILWRSVLLPDLQVAVGR